MFYAPPLPSELRIDPSPDAARQVAAALSARPALAVYCGRCERRLCRIVNAQRNRPRIIFKMKPSLPEKDFCRWCARATSERAVQAADNTGFVRFAQALLSPAEAMK